MISKSKVTAATTLIWFALISFLLGPLALWFILLGKKHRRRLEPAYPIRIVLLGLAYLTLQILLFFAPLHWMILLGVLLTGSGFSLFLIQREKNARFFALVKEEIEPAEVLPIFDIILAVAMAIYPIVYILALIKNIGDLDGFSIHLPSDVYTDGLQWMLYATPGIIFFGFLAWISGFKPTLRGLIYFYASLMVALIWLMVWERLDQVFLNLVYGSNPEPVFFSFQGEARYRSVVKIIYYGGAFILGIGYLVRAARTSVFFKRAVFLGLPSVVLYANLSFVLGDWNHYLSGLRSRLLDGHHYQLYRWVAKSELIRTPNAYRSPAILDEWSELEYQSGNIEKAKFLLADLIKSCGHKTYHQRLRKRAEKALAIMKDGGAKTGSLALDLPVIKPAAYLDQDWYALLSAVAFLKPAWTDLELKKKLLDLSISVQLRLPKLENVPDLILVLHQLDIPVSTCFLNLDRIKSALGSKHVPFFSLYGHWVPISGYDAGRNGFYYYSHKDVKGWDWLKSQESDLFYHHAGEAFGKSSPSLPGSPDSQKPRKLVQPTELQQFISSEDLAAHILDIGGVGLLLGDSTSIETNEKRATFLAEQGDVYYQSHENYQDAAEAYRQAAKLFPDDQIFSRMLYLKRRYWEFAASPSDYQTLFRDYPPAWMDSMGLASQKEKEIVGQVMEGKLGSYLMMNWYVAPFLDTAEKSRPALDTAIQLYTTLYNQDPDEPLYLDSLATLMLRRGNLKGAEKHLSELAGLYPFGNQSVLYRLAWVKLRLRKIKEIPDLLDQCAGFSKEAKYLTLQAAVALEKGHYRSAYSSLNKSLKLDKTLGESHALMESYYRHKGEKSLEQVHRLWLRRST